MNFTVVTDLLHTSRCNDEEEDFKQMMWSCRFSVEIWKETEKQKKDLELT